MNKNENLLAYVAELYYERGLSQKEIGAIVGVSRPTVSRLIEEAKSQGIVKIIIDTPISNNVKLSNKLRKTFNLRDAIVVSADFDFDKSIEVCSKVTASILVSYLQNNMTLGITWGRSINAVATSLEECPFENVHVAQMTGCMKVADDNNSADGYAITQTFAKKLHATYSPINAPLLVKGKEIYNFLISEPLIKEGLERAKKLDIAITGASPFYDAGDSIHRSGYFNSYSLGKDKSFKPVASVNGHFLDIDGNEVMFDDIYSIAAPLSAVKKAPISVLLNATAQRAEATMAVLNAKLVNILIVDETHARRLLDIKELYKK